MQNLDAALNHIVSLQVQYPDDLKLDNARGICAVYGPDHQLIHDGS